MRNNGTLMQEEKFLLMIDKYITQHRNTARDDAFYRKFYMLFVGYHLKYFYAQGQYSSSCFHVDNIMQMFIGVVSYLNSSLLRQVTCGGTLLQSLNALVNYISQNTGEAERVYAELLAQYEKKRIAGSMAYTPPRTVSRRRL
ncbi:hypothetical protein DU195_13470 [Salmonella enterica subsp. enterica serovar Telhashomer]|nr:hypothetical protein [Salmonella enterica subsp. enterica serovar Telhashomer]EBQ1658596.1 hypothetical protein [Salmonella enterica]EEC1059471.1 hypothetical protein [Salmonella enterica subsp. enterica]EBQ1830460.1 hypothetical protein [Salmonella enterica]EBQ4334843.1 hypothetical protein [Salmonella enterica]